MKSTSRYTLLLYAHRRLLALVVAVCVAVCAQAGTDKWDGSVASSFGGGSGTQAAPYLIATGAQLAYLADQVNSGTSYSNTYFKLANDIDLASEVWTPIGSNANSCFSGVFDGGDHAIWRASPTSAVYMGLFGYVKGASIKNLFVEAQINGDQTQTMYIGILAGYATSTEFDDCYTMGRCVGFVHSPISDIKIYAGGFCGYAVECTVSNSHNYATVSAIDSIRTADAVDNSAYTYAGGIAGYSEKSTYTCVSNGGDVTSVAYSHLLVKDSGSALKSYAYAGGIVGKGYDALVTRSGGRPSQYATHANQNTFTQCYNKGYIHSTSRADDINHLKSTNVYAAGICAWGGTATGCYNVGNVTAHSIWAGSSSYKAGASGIGWGMEASVCYNVGALTAECPSGEDNDAEYGAAITPYIWTTSAECLTYPISGSSDNDYSTVTDCYYLSGCCTTNSNNKGTAKGLSVMTGSDMPNTISSTYYMQDVDSINRNFPIFKNCKPYATTLSVVAVDSTHATLKGAYKYLTKADSVGFEWKLRDEEYFRSTKFPLTGNNPSSLQGTLSDLLRGKEYTYRIWMDEDDVRHYGDTLHFTTTCPAHNPVYRDTICYGSAYKEHDYDIKYGTTVTENDNGTAGFTGTYNAREGTFTYKRHLQTSWGCDSIMTLELTIAPTYEKEVSKTILDKQSPYIYPMPEGYRWETIPEEDRTFTTSGVKTLNLQTVSGCDSIVKLDLTITPTFDVFVNPNTAGWGEASVNKPYFTSGEMAEITATPAQYYHFVQWEKDGTIAATSATAKIPITASGTYTAIFAPDEFKVTTGVNNNSRGEIDPAGENSAPYATDYQITATPYTGYDFAGWSDGSPAGKERKYKVEPRDTTITALFEPHNYRVTTGVNDGSMGSVTEGGLKPYLSDFEITATPNAGYEFVGWSNGVSKGTNPYTYNVDARDTSITAQFAAKKILVTTEVEKIDGATPGDITQGGYIDYNYDTLIVATPRTGYRFKEWKDGAGSNPSRLYRVPATASTLTAVFEPVEVQISTTVVGNGSVNGANTYHYGDEVTLTPSAPTGYEFKQWQNGNTTSPLTFKINFVRDSTFTATFVPKQCNVRIEPDDINHGKVSQQSGSYAYGTLLEFTATAEEGYDFAGWSDGYQYAKRSYTVNNIDKDTAFVAKFTPKTYWVYTAVENGNTTLGAVSASQQCAFGASVTVTATPKTGYRFKQWDDGNTDNPRTYTLTIPSNVTLTAQFEPKDVLLTTKGTNGTVTPNTGAHKFGDAIEVTATPNTGYKFAGWKGIDEKRSTFTFNIGANDTTLEALFEADNFELTVRVQDDNSDYGSVSPSGTNSYPYQSVVPISVTANDGFKFVRWQENNKTAANFEHTMLAEAQTYTALFDTLSYYITTRAAESAQGTVTPASGSHKYRTEFEVKAIPNEGYEFDHWNDDLTQTSAEFIYTTPAKADELVAHFRPIKYHVTTTCDTRRGTVSPASDNYDFASQLSIKADALPGYKFLRWTNGSANNPLPYTVKAKSDTTFEALFEPLKYTVTLTRNNEAMGSVAGGGTYPFDTTVTITARPAVGYRFVRWSDGTTDADSVRSFHINVARDTTIQAIFTEKQYQVTTSVNYGDRGQVTAGGTKTFGTTFEITATPVAGYKFAGFTSDKWTSKVWNNPYDYTVAAYDLEIVAVFEPITYTITATVNDAAMGSVSPTSAQCDYKSSVNFTVTPKTGYSFVGWEDLSDTELTRNYTLTKPNDVTLKANFKANTYHITVQSANDEQGTVTGSGDVVYNTEVTIEASPKDGYSFQKWQDGDTHATRTIDHYRGTKPDSVFTAYFTPKTYTVKAEKTSGKGSVTPTQQKGTYKQSVDITATPARGYQVQSWNGSASNEQNYTYSLDEPRDTVVRVAFAPLEIMVYANANDNQMGSASITGGNKHAFDEEVTIEASPKDGYKFVRWENEAGTKLAGDASKTFTINSTSDTTFVAVFAPVACTVNTGSDGNGTVTPPSGEQSYNTNVSVEAKPNEGYQFDRWRDQPSDLASTFNYRVTNWERDTTFYALFKPKQYFVAIASRNPDGGTVDSVSKRYDYNSSMLITAIPNTGYEFAGWEDGYSYAARYITVPANDNSAYWATFRKQQFDLKLTSNDASWGQVTGSGRYEYQSDNTVEAKPNYGYTFVKWLDGKAEIETSEASNARRTITLTSDTLLKAIFRPEQWSLTARIESTNENYQPDDMGVVRVVDGTTFDTITGANAHTYKAGHQARVAIEAVPYYGYKFVGWKRDNSEDPSRSVYLTSDTTFVAQFTPRTYTVAAQTNNLNMGSVTGGGKYDYLTQAHIVATPAEHHHLVRWEHGSKALNIDTLVKSNITLQAIFAIDTFHVDVRVSNTEKAEVVSGPGNYPYGAEVEIEAASTDANYHFIQWNDGNTDNPRTVQVTSNKTYTAEFALVYNINVKPYNTQLGSTSGTGSYGENHEIEIQAYPKEGYCFYQWLDGSNRTVDPDAGQQNPRTITVERDSVFVATFVPIPKLSQQPKTHTICQGDTVRFENKLHQSNYWTRWTGDAIIGSNSDSVMYAAPDQSTTYKVEVGNEARDCTVSDSIRVIVIPKPTPQITASADSICQGDTVTLTATGDYTRYLWNTHSEETIIKVTPEKDSTFWLLAWNDFGCQADTVRYTIRVNAFGTRLEADKPTICMGDTATITCSIENAFNPALLNHTFRWRTSDYWLTPEGESSKTLQVSPREKTTYYCLVTDTTMGCTRWDSIAIDVNTRPKVLLRTSFDADAIFCAGDAAVLTVIPRDENSTDDLNFEWYRDEEHIGENAPTLIDYPEAAADGLNDTTYTYSVVVKSKNGDCESISEGLQTTVTVGALPLLPIAMIVGNDTLATNDTVCANTPVRLYAKQIDRTLFTYRWYSQEEKKEITNYDDGIDEYVDIVPEHTATYTLTIENTLTGCTRLVTRTIYTMPIPEITLMTSTKNGRTTSLDSLNVCVGDSVTLTVLDSDGAQIDKRYHIAWYKDDSTEPLSTDSAYVLPTSETSRHTYRVEVTNATSAHVKYVCTQTKARKIRVLAAPEPFALKAEMPNGELLAETICLRAGQPLILRSDMQKVEGLRYVWSDNIGTLASDTTAYEATPMRTTTYTLEASNGACSYTAQYTVNVASEPWQIGGSTTLCPDETTRVYVVGARTAYGDKLQWSTGEETDTIEIAEAGDYYVYLTHTVREGRVLKQETTLIQFTIAEAVAPEITIATPKAVCPNDATIALNYTVTAGEPVRCSLAFDEAAKAAHFQDVNGRVLTPMQTDDVLTGVIAIAIPDGATVGNYNVDVTVQNAAGCATTCTVPFVLSESTVALVLIDSTTVAVADSTAVAHYQWYKNGVSVGTDQFFFHETAQDSLNGIYKVVLTMRDGTELASCPVSLLTHTPPTTAPDPENPENSDPTSVCENTSLKMIYIDGDSLDGFSPAVYNYTVLLPYNTPSDKVPTAAHVSVDLANAYQTYVVAQSGSNAVQISVGSLCVPIDSGAIYTVQFVVDSARICRLTLNALPQSEFADSLIGGGEYRIGSVVELRAVAVNGYDFSHWSNDSSTVNPQRITIVSDTTIAAYFKPAEHFHYTIDVAANNSDWGTVTGGGYFLGGSTITIEATANDAYEFAQWSDGVSDNPRSVLVERDWTYIAQFRPLGDAIEEIAVDNCVVYVVHDRIFVTTDRETDLFVYNAIGQLIDHKARATEYTVRVPVAGLYLVNIGTKVVKVIVH